MVMKILSPQDHGVPHRRHRIWFVGLLVSPGQLTDEREAYFEPMKNKLVRIIDDVSLSPASLDDMLIPEGNKELQLWRKSAQQQFLNDSIDEDEDEDVKWPQVHSCCFRVKNLNYPPVLGLVYSPEEILQLSFLVPRCRDMVYYQDSVRGRIGPEDEEETMDLAQGLHRLPICVGASTCILPKSNIWLRKRFRRVTPAEALHLQGFPLKTRAELAEWSPSEISDLAGNAFCGLNVMAVLIGTLTCSHGLVERFECAT